MKVAYVIHPAHPTGVDLWRALDPCLAVRAAGGWAECVPLGSEKWGALGEAEVLVLNSRASKELGPVQWDGRAFKSSGERLRELWCRPRGQLLVVDVCDDPLPDPSNPLHQRFEALPEGGTVADRVLDLIANADLVTVNSAAMKERLRAGVAGCPPVEVWPDLIRSERWFGLGATPAPGATTVGVAGGDTHGEDWQVLAGVWRGLVRDHPGLRFRDVGHLHWSLQTAVPADRFDYVAWAPVDRYQYGYLGIDAACIPLQDTAWNRSKSPLKFLEHTLAGSAVVASPTVYAAVVEHERTGLLATDAGEWFAALDALVRFPDYRRHLNRRARRDVLERWTWNRARVDNLLSMYAEHRRRVYGGTVHIGSAGPVAQTNGQGAGVPAHDQL